MNPRVLVWALLLVGVPVWECGLEAASPGSTDSAFAPGAGLTGPSSGGYVDAAVVQPDGRILIAGSFTEVDRQARAYAARLLPSGAVDLSFNAGISGAFSIEAIALQPDGKILFGGDFVYVGGYARPEIVRLHPDGHKDESFASTLYLYPRVSAIGVQADGRVVIGGSFGALDGRGWNLARLLDGGDPDPDFKAVVGPADTGVSAIAVLHDGRILVAGNFKTINGVPRHGVAQLLSNGALDPSFDPREGANDWVYRLLVEPDGEILVAGYFRTFAGQPRAGVTRLHRDGGLDSTFAPPLEPVGLAVLALARQWDGKLILGGTFTSMGGTPVGGVVRVTSAGEPDPVFIVTNAPLAVYAAAVQADGKVFLGGAGLPVSIRPSGGYTRVLGGPYALTMIPPRAGRDGSFSVGVMADPNRVVQVAVSDDLVHWTATVSHRMTNVVDWLALPAAPAGRSRFFGAW
jgi:uncharacterized delta-60 repeat protein